MTEEKNQTVPILISKEGLTMIEGFLGRKKAVLSWIQVHPIAYFSCTQSVIKAANVR